MKYVISLVISPIENSLQAIRPSSWQAKRKHSGGKTYWRISN
jgi:hypothetical protein